MASPAQMLRLEVLSCYKNLLRTRQKVFEGDNRVLECKPSSTCISKHERKANLKGLGKFAPKFSSFNLVLVSRKKIREEFYSHRNEVNSQKIKRLLKIGWDAEIVMKKTIVQARLNDKGNYEVRITPDTALGNNAELNVDCFNKNQ